MMTAKTAPIDIFLIFLRLGLTAFGGPVAHLAYFRTEFVTQRQWLSEQGYADLVALCQFLPGPASSQVGLALGLSQAGYRGALAAWLGFTLPSALALIVLALAMSQQSDLFTHNSLQGLKIVALAVVAQAIWGMSKTLCPDKLRLNLMFFSACISLLWPTVVVQLLVLFVAALIGLRFLSPINHIDQDLLSFNLSPRTGALWLLIFVLLLMALPLLALLFPSPALALLSAFYRAGSLVFGGGHVVLPLLQSEMVTTGWINQEVFIAGYGATQAVPGPLFTFSAFLGASIGTGITAVGMGFLGLFAIFLPAFLLVVGTLPFWQQLRHHPRAQTALMGVNAAVVGLLLAVLYDPISTSTLHQPQDMVWALLAFTALTLWKLPPWWLVLGFGGIGLWI